MRKNMETKAVLESKYVMENHNAPLIGTGVIFAYAEQSKSFFSKDLRYVLRFDTGTKKLEFLVDRMTYDRQQEGKQGILVYCRDAFISFDTRKGER